MTENYKKKLIELVEELQKMSEEEDLRLLFKAKIDYLAGYVEALKEEDV